MAVNLHTWEHVLLSWAHEARHSADSAQAPPGYDQALMARAYRHCQKLTAAHSRSFFLASGLLPPDKRRAARALYAFCRVSDDIVDRQQGAGRTAALEEWRRQALGAPTLSTNPVAIAWADARARYGIPLRYAEQLIAGVKSDLYQTRYSTFSELAAYAYGVASTVGLMSMHIIGFSGPEAIPYAVKLGVALQLTNVLRDVGEDWRAGRVYLPQEELEAFGLGDEDLSAGQVHPRWREFMRFQIDRNRQLYAEAWPGIGLLHPDGRLAISAAADFYRAILDDIAAHDYNVFDRRAYVSAWGKLRRLPGLWRQSRRFQQL